MECTGTLFRGSTVVKFCATNRNVAGSIPRTAVAQWLKYCATNRKDTGSIPDGVIGIFH
jgi:hypothetical protein